MIFLWFSLCDLVIFLLFLWFLYVIFCDFLWFLWFFMWLFCDFEEGVRKKNQWFAPRTKEHISAFEKQKYMGIIQSGSRLCKLKKLTFLVYPFLLVKSSHRNDYKIQGCKEFGNWEKQIDIKASRGWHSKLPTRNHIHFWIERDTTCFLSCPLVLFLKITRRYF